jgi:hypothetical protein
MCWVDDKGKTYNTMLETGLKEINSFSLYNYYFKFGEMTPFDATSIMMKVQTYYDKHEFNPFDFVDYLMLRKVNFKLWFVPMITAGILENLKHFNVIVKLNWRMLKQKAMKGAV